MIQADERGMALLSPSSSHSNQTVTTSLTRHTQDVSDASMAEFEHLMAAMGYRQTEPAAKLK